MQHKPPQEPVRRPVVPPAKPSDSRRSVDKEDGFIITEGSLSFTNEGWRLVERYIARYPDDWRLVFKRGEDERLEIKVPEEVWRAFDRSNYKET